MPQKQAGLSRLTADEKIDVLLARGNTIMAIGVCMVTCLAGLVFWVAAQEATDRDQYKILERHEAELATREQWMSETAERMTRLEEGQKYIRDNTTEIRTDVQQILERGARQ